MFVTGSANFIFRDSINSIFRSKVLILLSSIFSGSVPVQIYFGNADQKKEEAKKQANFVTCIIVMKYKSSVRRNRVHFTSL